METASAPADIAAAYHRDGDLKQAEREYRRLLREHPNDPALLHAFGVLLGQLGQVKQAIEHLERAASARPDDAEIRLNLGVAYRNTGRSRDAAGAFREAVRLRPGWPEAHNNLGMACRSLGRADDALLHFREAVRLAPRYADAIQNLAQLLHGLGRPKAALRYWQTLLEMRPDLVELRCTIAHLLDQVGRVDEAAEQLQAARLLREGDVQTLCSLERILVSLGRADEAEDIRGAVIRAYPDTTLGDTYLAEGELRGRHRLSDQQIERMHERIHSDSTYPALAFGLAFKLAAVLEKRRDYDRAWACYEQANRLQRRHNADLGFGFDASRHRAQIDDTLSLFTPAFFERFRGAGSPSELPVFIVGMPRSGTTLVEQILASHPRVHGGGELTDIQEISRELTEGRGGPEAYPNCLERVPASTLREHAEAYVATLKALGGDAARVTDKLPTNGLHLGLIAMLFPRARVVYCVRDARDTCVSNYFHDFLMVFATSLRELGFAYREYERAMAHYRRVLPIPIHEVRYEELVDDPERVTRDLVAFCGLEWDDACLRFHANPRTVNTPSVHQVRQPVYRTAVARWRHFEKHLGPLFDALASESAALPTEGGATGAGSEPRASAVVGDGALADAHALHALGELAEAEKAYRRAIEQNAGAIDARRGYGLLLVQQGRHRDAVDHLRRALAARPVDPTLRLPLGLACLEAGLCEEAAEQLATAVRLRQGEAEAHAGLGVTYRRLGLIDAALVHLRQAVRLAPDNPGALNALGQLLLELDRPVAALEPFQRLLAMQPDSAELRCRVGKLLADAGRPQEAEKQYREALRLCSGDPTPLRGLAPVLEVLGRTDEAAKLYEDLAGRAPGKPGGFVFLARLERAGGRRLSDADLAKMNSQLNSGELPPALACTLAYCLGDALDRRERYEEAFAHYRLANDLQRQVFESQGIQFDPALHRAGVDATLGEFSADYFDQARTVGSDSQIPVFVVGLPRSGTSLVEQVLASHPKVFGAGELADIPEIAALLAEEGGGPDAYPACLRRATPDTLRRHAQAYLKTLNALAPDAERVTDALPGNFRHIGLIATLFPQARVVHCVRDPRDTCLSCYFENLQQPSATSLEHLAFAYRQYDRLMSHWKAVQPLPILDVAYEQLVEDPGRVGRELVAFCGLDWDDRYLAAFKNRRGANTPSASKSRKPATEESIGRWRNYAAHVQPLFDALGAGAEPRSGQRARRTGSGSAESASSSQTSRSRK